MNDSPASASSRLVLRRRVPREHIAALLLFGLAAVVVTWPLVTVFGTRLAGDAFSDATEHARHIWWIGHALQTGQPLFWQPLLGYPNGMPGAWLWGNPLQSFPAWLFALVMPVPAAFNLTLLVRLMLNGWAAYLLVRHLTGGRAFIGPVLAGLIFLTAPTFQGQMAGGHLGLVALWPGVLYAYGLVRLRETPTIRWMTVCAVLFVLALGGSILLLIFWLAPVTVFFLLVLLIERKWRALACSVGAAALGGVVSLVFLLPVLLETLGTAGGGQIGGVVRYSADLLAVITPSFYHPLYTQLDYTHRVLGINTVEGPGYIGIAAAVLALIAVWRVPSARKWLALAAAAWVLSLGPLLKVYDQPVMLDAGEYQTYITLPWAWVQNLPVVNIARTPARFNFTVALAFSVMAGYGAVWAAARIRRVPVRVLAAVVIAGFVLWDTLFYWNAGAPAFPTMPGVVPEEIAALSSREDVRAVFDIPWAHLLTDKDALYLQTGHQRPLIAGHVTRQTPVDPARLTVLQSTLDASLLDAAGADVIILHKDWDDEAGETEAFTRARLGEPFYEDARIAAFYAPDVTETAGFTAVLPTSETVDDRTAAYLYAPEPGWVTFSAVLAAEGREVTLRLNGEPIQQWVVDGELAVSVPIPLAEAGYATVELALKPACPDYFAPLLACRTLNVSAMTVDDFRAGDFAEVVRFTPGVRLLGASTALEADANRLDVALWWAFDQVRTAEEVRFVHVLDASGQLVAQADGTLGAKTAGTAWAETVQIMLPDDLPAGEYTVYTGWYRFPDLVRFGVESERARAQDGLLEIGTVTISR